MVLPASPDAEWCRRAVHYYDRESRGHESIGVVRERQLDSADESARVCQTAATRMRCENFFARSVLAYIRYQLRCGYDVKLSGCARSRNFYDNFELIF